MKYTRKTLMQPTRHLVENVLELLPLICPLFPPRYYFKKVSDEFDCGVVFEEVREDDAILPIFEEKIIGKVEKID